MESLISVIVPVYNVEQYVEKCVKSILAQTYKNIEVILIDDGSNDNSGVICDGFNDVRIKVIHKKNGGLSSARNVGIDAAHGEFLCFVDSDDYIDVDMIEKCYSACIEHQSDICVCRYHIVGSNITDQCEIDDDLLCVYTGRQALEKMLRGKIKSFAWNKMYRKTLFDSIHFPEGLVYEDIYIMHRLFLMCKNIVIIPDCLYYYVWRKDSIMHRYSIRNTYDNYMALKTRLTDLDNIDIENKCYLMADIIRVRLYFELVCFKSSIYDRYIYRNYIKRLKEDYKQLCITDKAVEHLSANELLKYKIFVKSSLLYRYFIGCTYDGCMRRVAEKMLKRLTPPSPMRIIRNSSRAVWFIGLPEYNNLGDCAIAYATSCFLRVVFPHTDIFEITEKQCYSNWRQIKGSIKKEDLIILQGGGNVTDIYPDQQEIRKRIIDSFSENQTVIMPQTVYFSDTEKGKIEAQNTYKLFLKCKKLTLACRERYTYDWIQTNYTAIDSILVPDIVFWLKYDKRPKPKRDGIVFCIRNDRESSWAQDWLPQMKAACLKLDSNIKYIDTILPYNISNTQYASNIEHKLGEIASSKLVITDRLHCLIFSALTHTPCIAIDNFNYKIKGICEWLRDDNGIYHVENYNEFVTVIEKAYLTNLSNSDANSLNMIRNNFKILISRIGENHG